MKPFAELFKKDDWKFIMSNGKEGKLPNYKSIMFPWAGHFIMRNEYGEKSGKDHFASFDVGPWGTSHQHNDQLNFTLYAGGRELLCDAGRMYYKKDKWRYYFNSSSSHNALSINGHGENRQNTMSVEKPYPDSLYSIQPGMDFCIGNFTDGYGDAGVNGSPFNDKDTIANIAATHTRAVVYLKDKFWLVFDYLDTKASGQVTANWHFAPDCTVQAIGRSVATNDSGKGNLSLMPLSGRQWDVAVVKGQELPTVQGWYSAYYNMRVPAPAALFTTPVSGQPVKEVWMMYPDTWEKSKKIQAQVLPSPEGAIRLSISIAGETPIEIAVNMKGVQQIEMSGGVRFTGRCVVLQKGRLPMLVNGLIED